MASGIYNTLDEATLLQMREDTLAELTKARQGKRFASVGGAGKSFTKDNMTVDQLKTELDEIARALRAKNPTKYGRAVRRMFVDFRTGS